MEPFILVSAFLYNKSLSTQLVTKQEIPKYKSPQNPTYQNDSFKKEINKKLFAAADSLIDKILSKSRIKLSNSQTLLLDCVKTGVLLSHFAQQLRLKDADVPDINFTLLDAAGISPALALKQNAQDKERGSWVLFEIQTSEAAKVMHAGCCGFWLCA